MIKPGNFYYRNWHTLALAGDTAWSKLRNTNHVLSTAKNWPNHKPD